MTSMSAWSARPQLVEGCLILLAAIGCWPQRHDEEIVRADAGVLDAIGALWQVLAGRAEEQQRERLLAWRAGGRSMRDHAVQHQSGSR